MGRNGTSGRLDSGKGAGALDKLGNSNWSGQAAPAVWCAFAAMATCFKTMTMPTWHWRMPMLSLFVNHCCSWNSASQGGQALRFGSAPVPRHCFREAQLFLFECLQYDHVHLTFTCDKWQFQLLRFGMRNVSCATPPCCQWCSNHFSTRERHCVQVTERLIHRFKP